jgi:hypothetical protein
MITKFFSQAAALFISFSCAAQCDDQKGGAPGTYVNEEGKTLKGHYFSSSSEFKTCSGVIHKTAEYTPASSCPCSIAPVNNNRVLPGHGITPDGKIVDAPAPALLPTADEAKPAAIPAVIKKQN